jgi:hypothetical protein
LMFIWQSLEKDIRLLSEEHQRMAAEYEEVEKEKATLYERFEETIEAVKKRSDFRNLLLEKKLSDLQADFDARQATLNEVRAVFWTTLALCTHSPSYMAGIDWQNG